MNIGNAKIGPGQPVYIVFEAGPTHDGLETAKKLVDVAASAGADAVKFQVLDAASMVSDPEILFTYQRLVDKVSGATEEVDEPLLDILKRREMPRRDWRELIAYCHAKGVVFFSTATNADELDFLHRQGVETVKICSGDVNYHHFLRQAGAYDWVVQLDTGSSSIGEVEEAVDVLEGAGCRRMIIHHCPSGYPSPLEGVNLRIIRTLQALFPYPIAFSDHSPGWTMDVAAVALGACMVEKTITLDKTIRSPEHIMSLEPEEAVAFVRTIRDLETAMGHRRRKLNKQEKIGRQPVRRSLFAAVDIEAGTILKQEMIGYARPGDGIPAHLDHTVLGRRVARNLKRGSRIDWADMA